MTKKNDWPVEIIRSNRRKKSVSAELKHGTLIVRAPATMSDAELQPIIANLKKRMTQKVRSSPQSNVELEQRAQQLNKTYFGGQLRWNEMKFVTNQNKRYGSCTPAKKSIRISSRLIDVPSWVLDYVIVHELAHLLEANHGPNFWALVNKYPLTERARGYLMALSYEDVSEDS